MRPVKCFLVLATVCALFSGVPTADAGTIKVGEFRWDYDDPDNDNGVLRVLNLDGFVLEQIDIELAIDGGGIETHSYGTLDGAEPPNFIQDGSTLPNFAYVNLGPSSSEIQFSLFGASQYLLATLILSYNGDVVTAEIGSPDSLASIGTETVDILATVPEPATWLSVAAGAFLLGTLRRRRTLG
jgi:hypothetical protein